MILAINKFRIAIFFVLLSMASLQTNAAQIQLHMWGTSIHLGGIPTQNRPLRISNDDTVIYNPGVGILVDFREHAKTWKWYGFSPIIMTNFLYDCDLRPLFTIGPGVRWRYILADRFSIDLNMLLNLANGEEWHSGNRKWAFLPTPFLGFNYHFDFGSAIGALMTYVPPNSGMSATSNSGMLFLGLNWTF